MTEPLELGLDTFGDVTADATGTPLPHAQVIRNVVDEAVLADELGVDFFGVGEHHRDDFAVSAPEVVLAAIAGRTKRIRLGSAVTVLARTTRCACSSASPRRRGLERARRGHPRARLVHRVLPAVRLRPRRLRGAVRGEARSVRRAARRRQPVTWRARPAPPLTQPARVPDRSRPAPLTTWVGVGGSPAVGRARRALRPAADARHHRRRPRAVRPLRRALPPGARPARPAGDAADRHALARLRRRDRRAGARGALAALQAACATASARERGWAPISRAEFDARSTRGSLYVGSPETVARKIAATAQALGARPAST